MTIDTGRNAELTTDTGPNTEITGSRINENISDEINRQNDELIRSRIDFTELFSNDVIRRHDVVTDIIAESGEVAAPVDETVVVEISGMQIL